MKKAIIIMMVLFVMVLAATELSLSKFRAKMDKSAPAAADTNKGKPSSASTAKPAKQAQQPVESLPPGGQKKSKEQLLSEEMYLKGLDAFNNDDYETARTEWARAAGLYPYNTDAIAGLRKIEELTGTK